MRFRQAFTRRLLTRCRCLEDPRPLRLHVDDGPALLFRLVPRLVEPADRRLAIVRPLALGVRVMDDAHEPRTGTGGRPLQHLVIAVRVAEREYGTMTDELVDAGGLAWAVVDEIDLRQAHQRGFAVLHLEL